eukprot:GDKH01007637.1.p1 GENE.GDKH01007637.1~~GDKH01007637.1.p1  ORF type:complete len:178 (-),score=8.10 GDKH01007637.1:155-688(-)
MGGFYHASLTFVGQWCDNLGMYLILGWSLAYCLVRAGWAEHMGMLVAYVLCGGSFAAVAWLAPDSRRYLFAAEILLYLVFEIALSCTVEKGFSKTFRYLGWSVVMLLTALGLWVLDLERILLCRPDCAFQLHAVWHALTAAASYGVFLYTASIGPLLSQEELHRLPNDSQLPLEILH